MKVLLNDFKEFITTIDFTDPNIREDIRVVKDIINRKITDVNILFGKTVADSISFSIVDTHIWKARHNWRVADLVDGKFTNHKTVEDNLKEVIRQVKSNSIFLKLQEKDHDCCN